MSVQQTDMLYYNNDCYSVLIKQGKGLPSLPTYNYPRGFWCAANPDGFYSIYEIVNSVLFLKQVNMIYDAGDLIINGKRARYIEPFDEEKLTSKEWVEYRMLNKLSEQMEERMNYGGEYLYENITLPTMFTGKILIAREYDYTYYSHNIGYLKAWGYKKVFELWLEEGKIIKTVNLSDFAHRFRELYNKIVMEVDYEIIKEKIMEWEEIIREISDEDSFRVWKYIEIM